MKGNFERLGYLFDLRRVRPSGLAGELVLSPEDLKSLHEIREKHPFMTDDLAGKSEKEKEAIKLEREFGGQLDRTPYVASFMTAGRPFMLATVHLVWGESGDLERRAEEAGQLALLLRRTIEGSKGTQPDVFRANLLVLGDFNAERDDDPIVGALKTSGLVNAKVLDRAARTTSDREGAGGKIAYDQFAWFPIESGLPGALHFSVIDGGSFVWDDYILKAVHSKEFRISDHYPLWLELSVRVD